MDALSTLAVGSGLAWAAGVRLYGVAFFAGLLGRLGVVALPGDLQALTHPLLIGISGVLFFVEFFVDKIPGVDSLWDVIHTFVRIPAGAALVAMSLGHGADPAWLMGAGLLGGSLAATAHFAKAGSRALINTSPEPFTNWAASFGEEMSVAGSLWLAFTHPHLFLALLVVLVAASAWLIARLWRSLTRLFRRHSLAPVGT